MKKIFLLSVLLLLNLSIFTVKAQEITWDDILLERSIKELHNILSASNDDMEREFMGNHLLIREDGYLLDNQYFDTNTTRRIKEKNLGDNLFCNKREFSKVFSLLKTNKISFLKATVKKFHFNSKNEYYIFFETMSAIKSKGSTIDFHYYNTYAVFLYKWNDNYNKGDYELNKSQLFRN
ncbi:hypothetical protein [Epilithonimonas hungarica]|uniref:Uncharacterized protein n=1 Tax=Epilithonimonas hungarica TaxID=454006 RepID=A0A1G7VZ15_9FLAO|nr:hypothetical protein [Epilithonimonas hungarica]SDG65014.1 hypothetical protein SAMN05421825_3765 [Epilithonimonas hungarica]